MGARKKAQPTGIKKKTRKPPQAEKKRNAPKPNADRAPTMADRLKKLAPGEFSDTRDESEKIEGFNPKSIYSPLEFIQRKPDENASPEEKVKFLTERQTEMAQYIAYLLDEDDCMKQAEEWVRVFPGGWPDEWEYIHYLAMQFGCNHGSEFPAKALTKSQKKQIVASLEGYCVQEDFDNIVSRLNSVHRDTILQVFATTFVMKTAIEKFFHHPFWYVETLPEGAPGECEEIPWQGVSPEGAVLERLLGRFDEVNPTYARIWRNVTGRLCNSTFRGQCVDTSFGQALKARRGARCHALAKEMLTDKVFQRMLAPTDSLAKRENALGALLAKIVEVIVPMLSQDPILKFRNLDEIEPLFHYSHNSMEADFLHYLDPENDDRHRLDGQRVLIIQYPFVVRIWSNAKDGEKDTVCKASAIIEDCEQE